METENKKKMDVVKCVYTMSQKAGPTKNIDIYGRINIHSANCLCRDTMVFSQLRKITSF